MMVKGEAQSILLDDGSIGAGCAPSRKRKCCFKEDKDAAEEEEGLHQGEEKKEEDMMESRILKRGRDVGKDEKKEAGSSKELLENE